MFAFYRWGGKKIRKVKHLIRYYPDSAKALTFLQSDFSKMEVENAKEKGKRKYAHSAQFKGKEGGILSKNSFCSPKPPDSVCAFGQSCFWVSVF